MLDLSIITPVFNEEEVIEEFCYEVKGILEPLGITWELICCVDPSTDNTMSILQNLRNSDKRIKIVEFAKRCGQEKALLVGMSYAKGRAIVTMDCDLQDPPEVIPLMLSEWKKGSKVVFGIRESRDGEAKTKVFFSKVFNKFLNSFGDKPIPPNSGEFRLIDGSIAMNASRFTETRPFLRGIINELSYDISQVSFPRPARSKGQTKYNPLLGGYKVAINGIFNFTDVPLKLIKWLGLFVSISSFAFSLAYAVSTLIQRQVPSGTTTIICFLGILSGLNLLCLSIMTTYISQIWLETRGRPKHLIRSTEGIEI